MKRAKLMLAAIAVVAIAGGVYASKAKRITDHIYVRGASGTLCTRTLTTYTLAAEPGQLPAGTTFATIVPNAQCPVTVPYYTGE
jgi:hypothetical protein